MSPLLSGCRVAGAGMRMDFAPPSVCDELRKSTTRGSAPAANYQLAQQEDKTAIFEEWCSFFSTFRTALSTLNCLFVNTATDSADFEKSIRIPYQQDGFDDVRAEYSQMLRQQLPRATTA